MTFGRTEEGEVINAPGQRAFDVLPRAAAKKSTAAGIIGDDWSQNDSLWNTNYLVEL
jgi:hypothetical protein